MKVDIILIGNQGSGKTSLIKRFTEPPKDQEFNPMYEPSIGINLSRKQVQVQDNNGGQHIVDLHIWDTAGQEKYFALTKNFFNRAKGVLVVFDVTDSPSFHKAEEFWMKQVLDNCKEGTEKILLGNKIDLEQERTVSKEQAFTVASKFDVEYYETSAKENIGLDIAFTALAQQCFNSLHSYIDYEDQSFNLAQQEKEQGGGCFDGIKSKIMKFFKKSSDSATNSPQTKSKEIDESPSNNSPTKFTKINSSPS